MSKWKVYYDSGNKNTSFMTGIFVKYLGTIFFQKNMFEPSSCLSLQ